jgi:hypothetical protein
MIGRVNSCPSSFVLAMPSPEITWCGGSTLPSIFPGEPAPHYSSMRRRPEPMIRMLVVGLDLLGAADWA